MLGGVKLPGYLEAGEHRLLIRAGQKRGRFDFSINICEPIDDILYSGNRYPGVRYFVRRSGSGDQISRVVEADHIREDWFSPYFASNLEARDPLEAARVAPDSLLVAGVATPSTAYLVGVAAEVAGIELTFLDSLTLAAMSAAPFQMAYTGWGERLPRFTPEPGRFLDWLGMRYDIRAGDRRREALKTIQGWLASGRIPLIGFGEDNWMPVTGYRDREAQIEIHTVSTDTTGWTPSDGDWWAAFPGRNWQNCPVIVVEQSSAPPSLEALTDSMVALALEMGLRRWQVDDRQLTWGERLYPAGLAAWDARVIEWDRMPLTGAWVRENEGARQNLASLGKWNLPRFIEWRRVASGYLTAAADRFTVSACS